MSSLPRGRSNPASPPSPLIPLAALTSLFFLFGFITCLNDILVPHLKAAFSLSYAEAALVQLCFFAAYAVVSLPAGSLVRRIGYQRGIVVGLLIAALGCLGFYPAAGARSYPLFLGTLFVLASGITLLQVSANPYVTVLGDPTTASSRLTLTQAFNSLGTFIAPYVGARLILSLAARSAGELAQMRPAQVAVYKAAEASSVQVPYLFLAGALGLLALTFGVLHLPVVATHSGSHASGGAWRHRHLRLGALAIFVYVGAEVSIGSFLVAFMNQPPIAALPEDVGGKFLTIYWGGAMVGRFLGAGVLRRAPPGAVLAVHALAAASLALLTVALSGRIAMATLLTVGLFNSIMFPTIFSLAVDGLGPSTEQGAGILCAAIVGGAVVPVAVGLIADRLGLHHAFLLPVACYLYIAFYGLRGSHHAAPQPA